jgi:hypothetical protein
MEADIVNVLSRAVRDGVQTGRNHRQGVDVLGCREIDDGAVFEQCAWANVA